ncbi:hypothetical protein OG897_32815 [Streptomyces sp. NBC_00237]|uniref:hypothetical protein n=1 Tax=Streptomyces sp. NBC_00237 TaxID=2975687 RepID=UPI0022556008|nr:hypothetical protein [Streptomyces sp. NBC_00237]MCX5206175.1 hypothetical protein [Streptomyces sp. NBC_00237]
MTLVQMQPRPRSASALPTRGTVEDSTEPAGLQVGDDMTVEVALAVMAGARTGHLFVCDNDNLRTGLVTRAQLIAARNSSAYTDRVQLRDLRNRHGSCVPPEPTVPGTAHVVPRREAGAPPAADESGGVPGTLALTH